MNQMKSQNLFAALSLILLVSACGKSLSLQTSGQKTGAQNQVANLIDASKVGNQCTASDLTSAIVADPTGDATLYTTQETLEGFSPFDMDALKDTITDGQVLKRGIVQIAPKEAISQVKSLELDLRGLVIPDQAKAYACVESHCIPLAGLIKADDKDADLSHLDLLAGLGITAASTADDQVKAVFDNSTEFAKPGYRKFRLRFVGVTSVETGTLTVQYSTKTPMSKNFTTLPTCLDNGPSDVAPQGPVAATKTPDAKTATPPATTPPTAPSTPTAPTVPSAPTTPAATAPVVTPPITPAANTPETNLPVVAATTPATPTENTPVLGAQTTCQGGLLLTQAGCMPKGDCEPNFALYNGNCIPVISQ